MKIIVTNNKKVQDYYKGKAHIIEAGSPMEVFEEGRKVVSQGGRLIHDPSKGYGYYRTLMFTTECPYIPEERDIRMLKKCTDKIKTRKNSTARSQELIFASIFQKQDLSRVKLIA